MILHHLKELEELYGAMAIESLIMQVLTLNWEGLTRKSKF